MNGSKFELKGQKMIDKKDEEIIKMLSENSRMPFTEMAKKLKVTEATIRKRVKDLEEEGVIGKYTIEINPEKLGYRSVSLVGVDTTPDRYLDIVKELTQLKEVKSVSTSSGDHMIMIEVWKKNNKELMNFIGKKLSLEGITKVCPAIILEKIK